MNLSGGHFDLDNKLNRIKVLEAKINEENFWNDIEKANKINTELSILRKNVENFEFINNEIESTLSIIDILTDNDETEIKELTYTLENLKQKINDLEIETLFDGEYDNLNCFLEIHPGAGGTESCDWAEMLLRMYTMFCEKNEFIYEIINKQKGENAGIKSVTVKISGNHAYGYLKSEIGVHRLVRISPFNAAGKRQTSFASVSVIPEIDDSINIEIKEEDLKIDVYRSSGCGGQGVNTTDSAVRITHIPTNIVITCQNERSQIKNKATALNLLKSKLFQIEQEKKQEEYAKVIRSLKSGKSVRDTAKICNVSVSTVQRVKKEFEL